MKKLGTHNSLSYLPCQWYLRPFAWIGRCQSLDLAGQYGRGVRWFDIRIKYKGEKTMSGHGFLTYDVDIDKVFDFLNSQDERCVVRIFLENSSFNPYKDFGRFATDVIRWQCKYPNIRFVEGGCRYMYRSVIEDNIIVRNCYWSKGDTFIPYPKAYAKDRNKVFHIGDSEDIYSIYDFIQY